MSSPLVVAIAWLALLGIGLPSGRALAVAVQAPHVQVELLADGYSIQAGHDATLGVRFTLEEGWHVYWKNPGDSGEPPSVRWSLPASFRAGELQWPSPERIPVGPLMNFGYAGTVLIPADLHVPADLAGMEAADIRAHVKWLVCNRDECIPGEAPLALTLPVSSAAPRPSAASGLFDAIRSRLPRAVPAEWSIDATVGAETLSLRVSGFANALRAPPLFFPSERDVIEAPAPQAVTPAPDGFRLDLRRWRQSQTAPASLDGVLTIGPRAYALSVPVERRAAGLAVEPLLFALAGGLLLNLMPCVFPVLAIKALALMNLAGEQRRRARLHGIFYAAGVLVSFWALAGGLLAMRAGGEQLGWGFQLQSPAFVAVLASLFFWMALILLDVSSFGASIMGVGHRLTAGGGLGGAFFTGVLATVVATPCAAPFMGTAMGYALTQPPRVALAVFTCLGLGLALPYVVLTCVPAIAMRLPRPGKWMETLKQLLAFPLLATVVWLVWVASVQAGSAAVLTILTALLILALAAWIVRQWSGRWARAVAAVFIAVALWSQLSLTPRTDSPRIDQSALAWEPYSAARLEQWLRQGKPVFVDFTAAWCVTCQVNERLALATAAVGGKMREIGVVPVRADWTTADPEITRALQGFGRDGVPLYVLYSGRKDDPPRILPQLLTSEIVLAELEQLERRSGT